MQSYSGRNTAKHKVLEKYHSPRPVQCVVDVEGDGGGECESQMGDHCYQVYPGRPHKLLELKNQA